MIASSILTGAVFLRNTHWHRLSAIQKYYHHPHTYELLRGQDLRPVRVAPEGNELLSERIRELRGEDWVVIRRVDRDNIRLSGRLDDDLGADVAR